MGALERLDLIQARLDAATPGPWVVVGDNIAAVVNGCTCGVPTWAEGHEQYCGLDGPIASVPEPDASLIAHAPEDLAALSVVVREILKMHPRVEVRECGAEHLALVPHERPYKDEEVNLHCTLPAGHDTQQHKDGLHCWVFHQFTEVDRFAPRNLDFCRSCGTRWPCSTVTKIEERLPSHDEEVPPRPAEAEA